MMTKIMLKIRKKKEKIKKRVNDFKNVYFNNMLTKILNLKTKTSY